MRPDRIGGVQLHRHLQAFSRWRRRLFGGAIAEPVPRRTRFASAGRDLTVTASLERLGGDGLFLRFPRSTSPRPPSVCFLFVGAVNYFGPKHTGSVAVWLALPTVAVVVAIILLSLPHLTLAYIQPSHKSFARNWTAFVGVILALQRCRSHRESHR